MNVFHTIIVSSVKGPVYNKIYRRDLTDMAFSPTKEHLGTSNYGEMHDQIDFVFADVNCNLAVRLKDGGFVYFESLNVFKLKINGL